MKSAVILAAGQSVRFNSNKMFAVLSGRPLIAQTVEKFTGVADEIILVTSADNLSAMQELFCDSVKIVQGGATRTLSALNGLNAVSEKSAYVAIHDGARPFVPTEIIKQAFEQAEKFNNAIPVTKMTDSVYMRHGGQIRPVEREKLCRIQTPQVFATKMIKDAYVNRDMSKVYLDDSEVYLDRFQSLHLTQGDPCNRKITVESDLPNYRIGNGFDVHQLVEGRKLILGGIEIPHCKGLLGHSDADVVLHAIMDSLLSAINERDIGVQFPPSDNAYKDISSLKLLSRVNELLKAKHAAVQNISCVVMAEQPKLAGFIPLMCKKIAETLNLAESQVSISATTTEQLGLIGSGAAIATQAVSLVLL